LDKAVVVGGAIGYPRTSPGKLVGAVPVPRDVNITSGEGIDAYIQNAKDWKDRLAQAKSWVDKMQTPAPEEAVSDSETKETAEASTKDQLEAWLEAQIASSGYVKLKDASLVTDSPSFSLALFETSKARISYFPEETIDIVLENVSTQPWLVSAIPTVKAKTSQKSLDFYLSLAGITKAGGESDVSINLKNLDASKILSQMVPSISEKVQGGKLDFSSVGTMKNKGGAWLNLPVDINLRDAEIQIGGDPVEIDSLKIPFTLEGAMDNPGVSVDQDKLQTALTDLAGQVAKSKAKAAIKAKINEYIPQEKLNQLVPEGMGEKAGEVLDNIGSSFKGLFGK
jgi:predicted RNase H-like HicB family nuclease